MVSIPICDSYFRRSNSTVNNSEMFGLSNVIYENSMSSFNISLPVFCVWVSQPVGHSICISYNFLILSTVNALSLNINGILYKYSIYLRKVVISFGKEFALVSCWRFSIITVLYRFLTNVCNLVDSVLICLSISKFVKIPVFNV